MITTLLFDLSRVLLFPVDEDYLEGLNAFHKNLASQFGPDYPAFKYFKLNTELLDYLVSLRGRYRLAMYTSDVIQNQPDIRKELNKYFDNVYSANELRLSKKERDGYIQICNQLDTSPNEVLYIDDQQENIDAANIAGLQTIRYVGNNDLFNKIAELLK